MLLHLCSRLLALISIVLPLLLAFKIMKDSIFPLSPMEPLHEFNSCIPNPLQPLLAAIFSRKKTRQFKNYYADWLETLKTTLLPLLRHSMIMSSSTASSTMPPVHLLHTHVESLHAHFQSYYKALDLAATEDVSQVLFPDWRNFLEKPFLWLGDFHPYIFTNLLRSFIEDVEEDDEEEDLAYESKIGDFSGSSDASWRIKMAWKNADISLMDRIGEIERGMRLIVPNLVARSRDAQAELIDKLAVAWATCEKRKEEEEMEAEVEVGEAVMEVMDGLTRVFLDANRLRRSVLLEIMGALDIYQAALFLEALAQFVVGFWHSEWLNEFGERKILLF